MIYGGRISLAVGLAAMAVAVLVGTLIGALAGMSRGALGHALMWLTDLFLSLPQLPLLLLLIYLFRDGLKAAFGPEGGIFILIVLVIGGLRWMPVARLVRAQFLSLREKDFVEAARALGASPLRQVVRHILPNALGPVIIAGTIDVAAAIIAESTLSFLGLGFPPDTPTWGRLLFDAKDFLDIAVTVLPQPDSPTTQSVSPLLSVMSMPSTACSMPSSVAKWVLRPLISSSGAIRSPALHPAHRAFRRRCS
jgi:peptide/nickel transport system permease protein